MAEHHGFAVTVNRMISRIRSLTVRFPDGSKGYCTDRIVSHGPPCVYVQSGEVLGESV